MTATDELRRMLDERGVEYRAIGDATFWNTHDGAFRYKAKSHAEKLMVMTCCSQKCTVMTPEQAIVATVGRGTCCAYEIEPMSCSCNDVQLYNGNWVTGLSLTVHVMKCSACGGTYEYVNGGYEYCPRCGRKVVSE